MTRNLQSVLELVGKNTVTPDEIGQSGLTADEVLECLLAISILGGKRPRLALIQVLLRGLETYLLSDNRMLEISRYPDVYLGREEEHIRGRVQELLGVHPPYGLVRHLRNCLTSGAATRPSGGKWKASPSVVEELMKATVAKHPRRELRCAVCGYHFLELNLGTERLDIARNVGAVFGQSSEPKRDVDELKPREYSSLEVDHVVPEWGFGWSDTDNLQLTCGFCNWGKMIFRRPFEALSTAYAGALSAFPQGKGNSPPRQVVVVGAIRNAMGRCTKCAVSTEDRELSARLRTAGVEDRLWVYFSGSLEP